MRSRRNGSTSTIVIFYKKKRYFFSAAVMVSDRKAAATVIACAVFSLLLASVLISPPSSNHAPHALPPRGAAAAPRQPLGLGDHDGVGEDGGGGLLGGRRGSVAPHKVQSPRSAPPMEAPVNVDDVSSPGNAAASSLFLPGTLRLPRAEVLRRCRVPRPTPATGDFQKHYARPLCAVSSKHHLKYVLMPKAASSSGRRMMKNDFAAPARDVGFCLEDRKVDPWWAFTVVREPMSRFYAGYDEMFARKIEEVARNPNTPVRPQQSPTHE
jgi:hypothetical protein